MLSTDSGFRFQLGLSQQLEKRARQIALGIIKISAGLIASRLSAKGWWWAEAKGLSGA